jgi:hypothetical protein
MLASHTEASRLTPAHAPSPPEREIALKFDAARVSTLCEETSSTAASERLSDVHVQDVTLNVPAETTKREALSLAEEGAAISQ